MLNTLRLVRGAVAKKDLVPTLTHFHVYDGRIQGGNSRLSIDCACTEFNGFNFTVPAERFLKAADACEGEPNLKITDSGKLSVSKKRFKALLPLEDHEKYPLNENPNNYKNINSKSLIKALRMLQPFIGDDATRHWTNGIWINKGFAYATNNVVLARVEVEVQDSFILPAYAVEELLRIHKMPSGIQVTEQAAYFAYDDGTWIQTQLITGQWPESVADMIIPTDNATVLPKEFTDAITKILPFCPEKDFPRLCLNDGMVATDDGVMSAEVDGFENMGGYFRAEPLLAVAGVANTIDFGSYPAPCYFSGDNIEGVLVGVKI